MNNDISKSNCCGCTACASVCSRSAISMMPDELGFLYPVTDKKKCNNCGLCEEICAFNPNYNKKDNLEIPIVYAVRHKDIKEIETSRSGAMFIALSDWILEKGGVIYGAGYSDHFKVIHKRAVTKEERDEFKGSKYVQSDLNDCFKKIKEDLKNGSKVLFSGTPCQTSGLRACLGNIDIANLYLCDICCHGVISPYYFRDYLNNLEKKNKDTIIKVDFRDKKFGWKNHIASFSFAGEKIYKYRNTFYHTNFFRYSCGKCHFTNFKRPSDITIGDFWGWEKVDQTFGADNKGVSLVLVNTQKGEKWFDEVKDNINFMQSNTTDCLQGSLNKPCSFSAERDEFEYDYINYGFEYVYKKYANDNKYNIKRIAKRILSKRIFQDVKNRIVRL